MVGRAGFGGKIVHSESCWSIVILTWKMAYYEVMVVMRVVDLLWGRFKTGDELDGKKGWQHLLIRW